MVEMCRLLAFPLVWQSNCASLFVCSESRHSGCSSTIQFSWGNCLFWLVAVLVVALLAVILGFVHVGMSIGIAKVLFFLFVLLFLVAVLGHVFRRP